MFSGNSAIASLAVETLATEGEDLWKRRTEAASAGSKAARRR